MPTSPDPVSPKRSQQPLPSVTPKFVLTVSPELKSYIFTASPGWADIVEAANGLRQQLGISRPAWIDACQAMGRYQAATAVAVIAAKRETIRSPGAQGHDRPRPGRRAAPEQQPLGPRPARAFTSNLRCVNFRLSACVTVLLRGHHETFR